MKCVITAGPTYEPLDDVRRLTNFSTGSLGQQLAVHLARHGHDVLLLKGASAVYQGDDKGVQIVQFTTTADLAARLYRLASQSIGAVFHAAAVNDFGFGRVYHSAVDGTLTPVTSRKFSSRVGRLLVELVPTPKILSELRGWFPFSRLVGWKYEIEGAREDVIRVGWDQIQACRTDACVVNGRAYGDGFGWMTATGECLHLPDKAALFDSLAKYLDSTPTGTA